jgi:tRNA-Thr(GGU) m(6)t(6)A37 methyltransferase TsaA
MDQNEFKISPIGYVRVRGANFFLELNKQFIPALRGLQDFSHVNVLWWCHKSDDEQSRKRLEAKQPYKHSPSVLGIFATRSQLRPNPIALSVAPILEIDYHKGFVHVAWMDAEDKTPIIDLKPYHPAIDRVRDLSVPKWCSHWPKWYEDSSDFDWASELVNAR